MDNTLRQILKSLSELESYDADLRYMALNDLYNVLYEDRSTRLLASQRVLAQVSNGILRALQDQNTEVQNQAVKALGALVVVYESELRQVLSQLLEFDSAVKDLALRAVLTNVTNTTENAETVIHLTLPVICKNDEPSIEGTDVFLELVRGYGSDFTEADVKRAFTSAKIITGNDSGLISKRAFDILQELAPFADDALFEEIVSFAANVQDKPDRFKVSAMNMLANLVEICPLRFTEINLSDFALEYASEVDEENVDVVEAALTLLRALTFQKFTNNDVISSTVANCISYNPNLGDVDADDDMDEDSDFADSEVEEDFDDDSEDSWKVRRLGVRVVTAMLLAGDSDNGIGFVPQMMSVIKFESNESVKKEILECLTIVASPQQSSKTKRRNSDASMKVNEGALAEYVDKIIELAKSDSEAAGYLPLLANLCSNYDIAHPNDVVSLCLNRTLTHKSQQISPCLEVIKSILLHFTSVDTGKVLQIIQIGLEQSLYKTQSLALEDAQLFNSLEVLPNVEKAITSGVSTAIRGAALEAAAKILASHIDQSEPIKEFVELATNVLGNDPEQRAIALTSLISLFKTGISVPSNLIENLIVQSLSLFTTTSPSITCSCLELLDIIATPESADAIASKVLELPNHTQYIDLKCKVLCHYPAYHGVSKFALEAAALKEYPTIKVPIKGSHPSPLISLFGKLANSDSTILGQVSTRYKETPVWAEIIAEILYSSGGATPDRPNPLSNWYIMVALFLTLHGRTVFEDLFDTTGVDPIIAGYCFGATAINTNSAESFLHAASTKIAEKPEVVLSGVEVIIMRAELSPTGLEKAWEASELLTQQNFTEKEELAILSRNIGALYAETGNEDKFSQWDNTLVGIDAAKAGFSLAKNDTQRVSLIRKFISGIHAGDVNVRASAAKSLAWITQIQPVVVEPYTKEIMANALAATEKDPSLVRQIQIGPYKHEIDDGLDYRKASYELIYLCISNFPNISIAGDIWTPILRGLAEKEDHDVKMLTCLIIQLIAEKDIYTIVTHLAEIMQLFTKMGSVVVKETGIKIEHDKKAAITRQIGVCTEAIRERMKLAHISDAKTQQLMNPK